MEKFNKIIKEKSMKKLLFLSLLIAGTLSAQTVDPYALTKVTAQNEIFFTLSPAEKLARMDNVQLVYEVPEGALLLPEKAVNAAYGKTGLTIAGDLKKSTIWHVKTMKKQGNKIYLMTAKTIDDVVAGLALEPDGIVLDKSLDPAQLRKILLDEETVPTLYRQPRSKIKIVENYDSCGTRADGTDLRIMSYNILTRVWGGGKMQVSYRMPLVVEIIKKAAPDFIGLQEVDTYKLLEKPLLPYKFIAKPRNMCALVYDSRKYREVKSDVWSLLDKPNGIRCLVWCLFEEIETGKQIVVTNTHWRLSQNQRINDGKIMAKYIADLQKMYPGVPIVCTGDFNTYVTRPDLQLFLKLSGLKDGVVTAPVKENENVHSYFNPTFLRKPATGKLHIDHVISTDDLVPLNAKLIAGEIVYEASDHMPIIVDFKRNK